MDEGLCLLMVDDSPDDRLFVERALRMSKVPYHFYGVADGSEAVSYLQGDDQYSDREKFRFPNVLLCDLKMAGMDGYALLHWLRDHPHCKVIPTIIFSSSALESDVHHSYVLGANAYLQKPQSAEDLAQTIHALYQFWVLCEVPQAPPGLRCSPDPH